MRSPAEIGRNAGLCARCGHADTVRSLRGRTFWLCGLSRIDPRFPKYPPLPVLVCPGYEDPTDGGSRDGGD